MSPRSRRRRPDRTTTAGGWIVRGCAAAVLVTGVAAFLGVMQTAPAVDASERIPVGEANWRPEMKEALYDRALYLLERADLALEGGAAGAPDGIISLQLALDGVTAAPANAYAWTTLALAAATSGYVDMARTAVSRSRGLAPNTGRLALRRLLIADVEAEGADEATLQAIRHDMEIARRFEARRLKTLMERAPEIAALADRLGLAPEVAPQPASQPSAGG